MTTSLYHGRGACYSNYNQAYRMHQTVIKAIACRKQEVLSFSLHNFETEAKLFRFLWRGTQSLRKYSSVLLYGTYDYFVWSVFKQFMSPMNRFFKFIG